MERGLESASTRTAAASAGRARLVLAGVVFGCAATILVGALARADGHRWGAGLAPFVASVNAQIDVFALPAALIFGGCLLAAPKLLDQPTSPWGFAAASFAVGLLLRLALAAARGGPVRWYAVFATDPEAAHEYLPALPALKVGLHAFLAHFAAIAPTLPTHASGHPPGLLVTLDLLGIRTPRALAALTIGIGALAVPLTRVVARPLLGERRARIAALLFAFAPSALLYGATSADALYATLALAAAGALLARGPIGWILGPALLALASFYSFALLGVGALVVLSLALRGERAAAAWTTVRAAVGVLGFYALLAALTGFDLPGTLQALSGDYHRGIAAARPYAFWVFGSPVAYLVALGLPITWAATRALAAREAGAVALAAVIAISTLLGFTKAETERIWLFLVPFACICAATVICERKLRAVLGVLALQAFTVELLLFTIW